MWTENNSENNSSEPKILVNGKCQLTKEMHVKKKTKYATESIIMVNKKDAGEP